LSAIRPTPAARGYRPAHRALRKRLAPLVASGCVRCARCGQLIRPDEPWDLGHSDWDRTRYSGPEHRRCNRAVVTHLKARVTSRDWLGEVAELPAEPGDLTIY
jgi:hypothetical protein